MNYDEVNDLLTAASGFDRRTADDVTVAAWHYHLGNAQYADAFDVVMAHFVGPQQREYLTIGHVMTGLSLGSRSSQASIEADVRSAKARGIVPKSWPEVRALDAGDAARLAAARVGDVRARVAIEARAEAATSDTPIDPGVSLKSAPRGR